MGEDVIEAFSHIHHRRSAASGDPVLKNESIQPVSIHGFGVRKAFVDGSNVHKASSRAYQYERCAFGPRVEKETGILVRERNPDPIVCLGSRLEPIEYAAGLRNVNVGVVRQQARESGQRHLAISLAEVAIAGNRLKRKKIACKRLKQRLVEHVADG